MKDNARKIIETAAQVGVCKDGKQYLKNTVLDTTALIQLMKAWPEYIQEHSENSLDILHKNMDGDLQRHLAESNIFIDYQGAATIGSDTANIVMGDSNVEITVLPFSATKIYIFNNSNVRIIPGDHAIIDIEAWNDSKVIIAENDTASTIAYVYDQADVAGAKITKRKDYQRGKIFNGKRNKFNKM